MRLKFTDQFALRVHACVGDDPNTIAKREWLLLAMGFFRGPQKSVTQTDIPIDPGILCIRTTKRLEFCQALDQLGVYRCAVKMNDANDSTH